MTGWKEAGLKGKFQVPSLWDRTQEVGMRLREVISQGWEKVDHNFLSSIFSLFLAANIIFLLKGSSLFMVLPCSETLAGSHCSQVGMYFRLAFKASMTRSLLYRLISTYFVSILCIYLAFPYFVKGYVYVVT